MAIGDVTNDPTGDLLFLLFDDEHDGTVASNPSEGCGVTGSPVEDMIGYWAGFLDAFYCRVTATTFGFADGGGSNGAAARTFTPGVGTVYELSHPLDSGDPDDYALAIGDTFGLCLSYDDSSRTNLNAFGELQWPATCFDGAAQGSTAEYADVTKLSVWSDVIKGIGPIVDSCEPCPPWVRKKLLEIVEKAVSRLERGDEAGAVLVLQGFVRYVRTQARARTIPAAQAQRLADAARAASEGLTAAR